MEETLSSRLEYRADHLDTELYGDLIDDLSDAAEAIRVLERQLSAYKKECQEVENALGDVLGYPWYMNDQKNFPGATEAWGVCVGDHTPGTLAQEAAGRIRALKNWSGNNG